MRGQSRFRQLSITFSISRNAIGQSLLWKFAGEQALKKKWRPQVREKWDAFAFSFASILILSRKKNERDCGRDGGKNKMANVLTQTVGEAKFFSET